MSAIQWPKTIALSEIDKIRIEAAHDRTFRERLLTDPAAVLASRGVEIPAGLKVQAVADTSDTYHLTVPPFVGQDTSNALAAKASNNPSWACTTCTASTPICIGSFASLICIA